MKKIFVHDSKLAAQICTGLSEKKQTDFLASNLRTKVFSVFTEIVFSLTFHHIQYAHHVIIITIIIIIPRYIFLHKRRQEKRETHLG